MWWSRLTGRLESASALDPAVTAVDSAAGAVLRKGPVKDLLHGTPLGHPVHPLLVALPIGLWSGASLMDLLGDRRAARRLVAAGLLSAPVTAVTGLADWTELGQASRPRRVGLVHALANATTVALYAASWRARRRGEHGRGAALSLLGLGGLGVGGYLGGHLAYSQAVGVNRNADVRVAPRDWADVAAEADVVEGRLLRVEAARQPVLLVRRDGQVHAVGNTCSHWGAPLDSGELDGECVVCPWHGSTFRLADGGVERGPATAALPGYDVRVVDGRVQVRAVQPGATPSRRSRNSSATA